MTTKDNENSRDTWESSAEGVRYAILQIAEADKRNPGPCGSVARAAESLRELLARLAITSPEEAREIEGAFLKIADVFASIAEQEATR